MCGGISHFRLTFFITRGPVLPFFSSIHYGPFSPPGRATRLKKRKSLRRIFLIPFENSNFYGIDNAEEAGARRGGLYSTRLFFEKEKDSEQSKRIFEINQSAQQINLCC